MRGYGWRISQDSLKDFSHPVTDRYLAFIREYSIDVAGIEMILDQDQPAYTYDINFNTNHNQAAERLAGISNYTNR